MANNDKYLDPRHFAPPYVVDLRNEKDPGEDLYSDEDWLLNEEYSPEEDADQEIVVSLEVPTSFEIVGQYVRPQKNGTFLVDVEIELPDIEEAVDFEIRTAMDT